jgi:hypothetical protein
MLNTGIIEGWVRVAVTRASLKKRSLQTALSFNSARILLRATSRPDIPS